MSGEQAVRRTAGQRAVARLAVAIGLVLVVATGAVAAPGDRPDVGVGGVADQAGSGRGGGQASGGGGGAGGGGNGQPDPNPQAGVACENTAGNPGRPRFCTAPTLTVADSTSYLTDERVADLGTALGLPGMLSVDDDGAVRYMDQESFQAVPTIVLPIPDLELEGDEDGELPTERHIIDVVALQELVKLDAATATGLVNGALTGAGLLPATAGEPLVHHSEFTIEHNPDYLAGAPDAVSSAGLPEVPLLETIVGDRFELDTQVSYPLAFNGIPIVGPGAKVKVSFGPVDEDGEAEVTQLLYAASNVTGVGQAVEIVPPELHVQTCVSALDIPVDSNAVTASLVYYAPELSSGVGALQPHIQCSSSGTSHEGDEILSRNILLPAAVDAPSATIAATTAGSAVTAVATVVGGTPPYSYSWQSANLTGDPAVELGPSLQYALTTPGGGPVSEELVLWVTDAKGLTAVARADLVVEAADGPDRVNATTAPAGGDLTAQSHGNSPIQFGTEFVGTYNHAADLRTGENAAGFWDVMVQMATSHFYWGNNDAWERDFRDSSTGGGGDDHNVVDDVDIAFFTGHAGGNGWNLESSVGDNFVHYNDTRLGQTDLEWMVIGACGVLQEGSPSFATRWGATFKGLHMLLGYATVSNDTTQEGRQFANYLKSGWKLYQAWGQQAINIQPSSVVYGYAGPVGYNGEWNAHDYFWNKGAVSADVTNVYYIWRTVGNA